MLCDVVAAVASKGTPGDAKCVTEIPAGTKIRKLRGGQNLRHLRQSGMKVKYSATQTPLFDVSVPEKLLKIVATRSGHF